MYHYTFFPGANKSYRQQMFSLWLAHDDCGSNAPEHESHESHVLLYKLGSVVCSFLLFVCLCNFGFRDADR
jgi:hypothetical protein